jgi:O-antigen/teichoic acid export membrane protein
MFKGTLVAQIIGTLGGLFLAKMYGSEAYGIFGIYISITSVISIINTLQLENTIITIKDKNESKNLVNSLFHIVLLLTFVLFFLWKLAPNFINTDDVDLNLISFAIIISVLFSFNKIHEAHLSYTKKFKFIARSKVITIVLSIIFQYFLYASFQLKGLIYGNAISIFFTACYFFIINKNDLKKPVLQQLKTSINGNTTIIKYFLPSTIINAVGNNILPMLIVFIFSTKDFGVYFLSAKILSLPLFMLMTSVTQVYYQRASKMFFSSRNKLYKFTSKIVISNIITVLPILVFINTIGIYLLEFYFNKNWENLRFFTLILSFIFFCRAIYNPISDIMIVINKNQVGLILNIYLFFVNAAALFIGYSYHKINYTIIVISIFGGIGYLISLLYLLKKLKQMEKEKL